MAETAEYSQRRQHEGGAQQPFLHAGKRVCLRRVEALRERETRQGRTCTRVPLLIGAICSRWLESRDFINLQIILNHSQVKLEADGSFRIVVHTLRRLSKSTRYNRAP